MLEYKTTTGKKVTVNPEYVISISEACTNEDQCYIHMVQGYWIVKCSYEEVKKHLENFEVKD